MFLSVKCDKQQEKMRYQMSALKPSLCYLRSHNGLTPEYFSLRVEVANGRCCINGSFWL